MRPSFAIFSKNYPVAISDRYPARLRAKDGLIKHVLITSNSRFQDGNLSIHAALRRM
jgi:hypothetical protein